MSIPIVVQIEPHEDGVHCGRCYHLSEYRLECKKFRKELTAEERCQACKDAEKLYEEMEQDKINSIRFNEFKALLLKHIPFQKIDGDRCYTETNDIHIVSNRHGMFLAKLNVDCEYSGSWKDVNEEDPQSSAISIGDLCFKIPKELSPLESISVDEFEQKYGGKIE